MNKADKIFIIGIILCVCVLYVPSLWSLYQNQGKQKEIVVSRRSEEILRKPLSDNAVYEIEGSLGMVSVEVQDEQVRVEKETSPYHLCSIQGWVEDVNRPIVCLPNDIVVQIETQDDSSDDLDVVIQ